VFSSKYNYNYNYNDTTVDDNNQLQYKITENDDFKACDYDRSVAKQRLHLERCQHTTFFG